MMSAHDSGDNDAARLLEDVARATDLREGPDGVRAILDVVRRSGPISPREAAARLGLPLPVVAAVRRECEKRGLLARDRGMTLSEEGRRLVHDVLGMTAGWATECATCRGHGIVVGESLRPALEALVDIEAAMPSVDTTLDQSHGVPESALRRALYLHHRGALDGRRVIFLGDDDLLSVACGLIAQIEGSPRARELVALDCDARVVNYLGATADARGFALDARVHDLRRPLPEDLRGRFDAFVTDPPYTAAALELFVSRGLSALEPGPGRHGFLAFAHKPPEEMVAAQALLARMGLHMREVLPGFNAYERGGVTQTSQMIHLVTTAKARPTITGDFEGALYTKEINPWLRAYRCQNCRCELLVGPGRDFATIELLKAAGCPECGGDRFRRGRQVRAPEAEKPEA